MPSCGGLSCTRTLLLSVSHCLRLFDAPLDVVSEAQRSLAGCQQVHSTEEEPDPGKQTYNSQDFVFVQGSVLVASVPGVPGIVHEAA